MNGVDDLAVLLGNLNPVLQSGEYVFVTLANGVYGEGTTLQPIASFAEHEGLTLVIPERRATEEELPFDGTFRLITLSVYSDLHAVGLTAAVAGALSRSGIPANVIAAFHHDHVLVPTPQAEEAMAVLNGLITRD
ncbi:MAG: ACT domain-containing protein [Planctomycetota bacterium]